MRIAAHKSKKHAQEPISLHPLYRGYIQYLVTRYHRLKSAPEIGHASSRASYATIYDAIRAKFNSPAYFVQMKDFDALVDYLQGRIDLTAQGKLRRTRGSANYKSFAEYEEEHSSIARPSDLADVVHD